ncbi:13569_t:CDS:2 [Ambispora leptoticha]|uniref:13569_t:CDS:1 n=1 Tax=Ambispora leptoticha TaxID=144679 RepID=A0A9N8VEX0_9GLOM|nr:13569_t:CDS:2 [Ambispora leptoticha]
MSSAYPSKRKRYVDFEKPIHALDFAHIECYPATSKRQRRIYAREWHVQDSSFGRNSVPWTPSPLGIIPIIISDLKSSNSGNNTSPSSPKMRHIPKSVRANFELVKLMRDKNNFEREIATARRHRTKGKEFPDLEIVAAQGPPHYKSRGKDIIEKIKDNDYDTLLPDKVWKKSLRYKIGVITRKVVKKRIEKAKKMEEKHHCSLHNRPRMKGQQNDILGSTLPSLAS